MILAGGQSRRMGSPKALLDFCGKALIEYPLSLLNEVCSEVFIVTKNPELYQRFRTKILTDLYKRAGPMGGICTGLQHASNPWSIVLACDMPFVRKELLLKLLQQIKNELNLKAVIPIAPAKVGEELILQPLCALYSKNCLPFFHHRIMSNQISLFKSMRHPETKLLPWLELDPEDQDSISFININTTQELEQVRTMGTVLTVAKQLSTLSPGDSHDID